MDFVIIIVLNGSDGMKNIKYTGILIGMLILSGCDFMKESVYTLSQTEVSIPVHDQTFDPLDYLLKDGEPLTESDRSNIKTGAKIDTSTLGNAVFKIPEYHLELTVHIVDEEAPEMSILGYQIKKGVVFTWNEENLNKLKPQLHDNYDSGDLLKKTMHCDSVDTSRVGKQNITCYIEDSSGNQTKKSVEMEVVE